MAINIKYITVGELESYVSTDAYLHQTFFPISIPRAISHANNPRSTKEDIALILAYDKEILVGYLGTVPDSIHHNKKNTKVCWISCMWVLPEYRRSGIAKLLLNDADNRYQNRILITNYISQSKAAFSKDNQFSEVAVLEGVRSYLKLDFEQIIIRKKPRLTWMKGLFRLADNTCNFFLNRYFRSYIQKERKYRIESIDFIDQKTAQFVENRMQNSIFKRGEQEFNWLRRFPWVLSTKSGDTDISKYYFSQYHPDFRQWIIKITDQKKQVRGIALLTRHKRELKTPYIIAEEGAMEDLFNYVYQLMLAENIRTLVTHSDDFVEEVKRRRKQFLMQRSSRYGFMTTPEIVKLADGNFGHLYEGDGDGMFT